MTASPSPDSPQARAWSRAEAHALAAASLLDDPSVPPWVAAYHLRRGWSALVLAWHGDGAAGTDDVATITWVRDPKTVASALRELPSTDDIDAEARPKVRPAGLEPLSLALAEAVGRAARERFAPSRDVEGRRHLLRRAAMAALVLLPVAVFLVLTVPDHREGPWRGQYFDTQELEGEPTVMRRDGDIKFDWKRKGPSSELPDDHFSIRWDTCMELAEELEVSFQLVSDDGSRLFVDGELVVDNWGPHGERSRGGTASITAGVHHLRVEYFDERHAATLELAASLHGELPDSIPVRILHYPGDEIDEDDPCAAIRE